MLDTGFRIQDRRIWIPAFAGMTEFYLVGLPVNEDPGRSMKSIKIRINLIRRIFLGPRYYLF